MTERTSTSGNNVFSESELQALLSHAELGVIHTSEHPAAAEFARQFHDAVQGVKAGVFFDSQTLRRLEDTARRAMEESLSADKQIIVRQFQAALAILPADNDKGFAAAAV